MGFPRPSNLPCPWGYFGSLSMNAGPRDGDSAGIRGDGSPEARRVCRCLWPPDELQSVRMAERARLTSQESGWQQPSCPGGDFLRQSPHSMHRLKQRKPSSSHSKKSWFIARDHRDRQRSGCNMNPAFRTPFFPRVILGTS
jgi:hypothetical protein